jgi:hypothetical protein
LNIFLIEKLLKDSPNVPIKEFPPYPPCSSIWLEPFSATE